MSPRRAIPVLLPALLAGCTRTPAPSPPPPPLVRTFEVTRRGDEPLELRGSVTSQSRIRLGFKQPGVVAAVRVKEGDRVAAGQLVARLDDVDARSQLRMAVAGRDKARRDADRAARLAEEGAVPTGARDDAMSQLEAAEAQVAQAQDALERTRLLAPAAGAVFVRLAEPGETIGAGSPVVVLDTTRTLVVKAGATLRELQTLALGQAATLAEEDGAASLPGRVTSIATTPSPADGLYLIEVTPQAETPLRPGTLLRMRFAGAQARSLRIPLEALVHRQDRDFVFLVEAGPRVRQLPIEVDRAEGGEVVVRTGLSGGERVVAEGAYFLEDGQTVRVLH